MTTAAYTLDVDDHLSPLRVHECEMRERLWRAADVANIACNATNPPVRVRVCARVCRCGCVWAHACACGCAGGQVCGRGVDVRVCRCQRRLS